jgi:hypothetical protein
MRARRAVFAPLAALALLVVLVSAAAGASEPAPASPWFHVGTDGEVRVDLWYGYSSTCPHCQAARPHVQQLERDLPWLDVHWLQVNAPDSGPTIALLEQLVGSVGGRLTGVPLFVFGRQQMVGWDSAETTGAELRQRLVAFHASLIAQPGASPAPTVPPDTGVGLPIFGQVDAATVSLPLLAVTLGGLDAFNPCALSVLLFLMSVLVGTRDRRRMAIVGGTFVAVSGIVYFVLMAAWLNLFLVLGALRVVTLVAGAAAVLAALINLKDHVWFGRGPSLVIPAAARPTIFGRILDLGDPSSLRTLLPATILVATVVNAYEMLCTGGFPVVFTRVLTLEELPPLAYYGYLALYCLVYVVPAALIVAGFTLTLGSRGVTVTEARNLKLLSGLLMLGFGMLLLVSPDLLTDLATAVGLLAGAVGAWLLILLAERLIGRPTARAGA